MGEEDKKQEEEATKTEEPETKKAGPDQDKKQEPKEPEKIHVQVEETTEAIKEQPQPQEIVLRVFMHCEGCARKVRRSLKAFQGVESVETDCRTHKVVVKGEKADPLKVLDRVQRKSHRRVELISPIPEPPPPKPQHTEMPKTEDSKPQLPQIVTVVLKVHMHCEACAQEIKRRIHRMKGVESVDPDLKSSQVTVKGAIDPSALVEYVHRRTGKHAAIVKQEPEIKPENLEEAAKEANDEKKGEEEGEKKGDGSGESEKKVDEESKVEEKAGGGEGEAQPAAEEAPAALEVEVKKNEYLYYPQRYIMEMYPYPPPVVGDVYAPPHMAVDAYPPPMIGHAYPPQMFSDENPNACSVM